MQLGQLVHSSTMAGVGGVSAVCLLFRFSLVFFAVLEVPRVQSLDYDADVMAPVILVPGLGGTQIEGKWHTHGHPDGCDEKEDDWDHMWLSMDISLHHKILKCWAFRFILIYDRVTHRCRNQEGVTTRVPWRFGSCKPIDELTNDFVTDGKTEYYHEIIEALKKSGYNTDHSLKGAGYDWRYAPPQLEEFGYFNELTGLVERMAADNKRKVALVAHSMGGLVLAYFLRNKTQEWKDKHVHAMITLSTPWLGSPQTLINYLVGTTFGLPHIKKSVMKDVAKTLESVAFLLPTENEYNNEVLVDWTLKNKKYTAKDYQQFFTDIGFEDAYFMRRDLRNLFPVSMDKLGVRMVCVWSNLTEPETLKRYQVNGEFSNADSIHPINGEGDRTVPLKSLRYCERFTQVSAQGFQGPDHSLILSHKPTIDHIMDAMRGAQPFA